MTRHRVTWRRCIMNSSFSVSVLSYLYLFSRWSVVLFFSLYFDEKAFLSERGASPLKVSTGGWRYRYVGRPGRGGRLNGEGPRTSRVRGVEKEENRRCEESDLRRVFSGPFEKNHCFFLGLVGTQSFFSVQIVIVISKLLVFRLQC